MCQTSADTDVRVDSIDHAREERRDNNDHRDQCTEVDALPVSIDAMRIVELWHINLPALDKPIVADHDASHWRKEDHV